ncbi:hypothetical protein [Rhizobium mongolense]|uniref:Tail protein n=1 Tax=Rhizobium mongolense TaxID=57676 RepID=A0A7W6RSC0_9HYPH|nr:hypothetical protein [Rhizobium mongolense]MBB4277020.1 hypothetical protein [Rhizobium mongolense]
MKRLRTFLLAGASYAAMTANAHADPISLIATAIHGFLLSSTAIAAAATGTIATVAANVIVGGALIGASLLGGLAGRQMPSPSVPDAKSTFESSESAMTEGGGVVGVGGMKAFGNTDGSTRWRLVARLRGPIDAVQAYYVGGREVIVDSDGIVTSPPWARSGSSWMRWEDKIGDGSETAWPALVSAFPTLWTSAHRARGLFQSLLTYYNPGLTTSKYLSLYQSGVPDTWAIVRASLVYDPRNPAHEPLDVATWEWTENGILLAAHVLRRDPFFFGYDFEWDKIGEQATKAEVSVATLTGTEPRSRFGGVWNYEATRSETMQEVLDSIGAEIRLTAEGKIWFELIDDAPEAEISFGPRDFYDVDWSAGPEAVERPNICRVSYYSPERNFEVTEVGMTGIAWATIDDEVTRYGPKYLDVKLPFCPSASQAQRIARRKFAIARGEHGNISTNMVGLAAWGRYYADVEWPDLDEVELVRMEAPRIDDSQGTVEIPFVVWPNLPAWNPETDEAPAPAEIPPLNYVSDLPTPAMPSAALQITYPDSSKELRLGYALTGDYSTIEANYRTYTGALPNAWQGMTEVSTFAYAAGDFTGQTIDGRVRTFDGDEASYFSPELHTVIAADNSACAAPTYVSGGTTSDIDQATLSVVVKAAELRAAAIRLQRQINGGSFVTVSTVNVRPGVNMPFDNVAGGSPPSGSWPVNWRLQTLTSNGTVGASLSFSAFIFSE